MKRTLSVLMMALLATLLIVSCSNSSKKVYTVTFNPNGGSKVAAIEVKEGEKAPKPTDPTKAGFDFVCWTKDGIAFDFDTETITEDMTLVAKWKYKTYSYGDIGPAGGIIFYDVDADNDVIAEYDTTPNHDGLISSECGWRYLEGALTNVTIDSESSFCFGYYRVEGENTKIITDTNIGNIGKGKTNTKALVDAMGSSAYSAESGDDTTSNYAAYVASSYTFGGYNDWFLPSVEEIKAMMNVSALDVTKATALWSSSELSETKADIAPYEASGDYTSTAKSEKHQVRPVRSF